MIIIGITGGSASGKTTIAQSVFERLQTESIALLRTDNYYNDLSQLSIEERALVNFDHPDSLDFELLNEHLVSLKKGLDIAVPVYDFVTHNRTEETILFHPPKILIVEGILLFNIDFIRDHFNVKVFVDTAADLRIGRRILRDVIERSRKVSDVIEQYYESVRPMHNKFIEPSKKHADIIVPNDIRNNTAIDLLEGYLKYYLSQ